MMGMDLYFYKLDPQGDEELPYVSWMGDVYTEVDINHFYNWNMFNLLHPEFNIDDYEWSSYSSFVYQEYSRFIGRDTENGSQYNHYKNKKTGELVVIEDEYIPTYVKPYLKTFAREVFYCRKGYGGQALGEKPEKGEIDVKEIWSAFDKDLSKWQPSENDAPLVPKDEWIALITKDKYKWILNLINNWYGGAKYNGVRKLDYDAVYVSY
jgi:hypothetical protein